jgi:myo-inositol 2-dehydrogenase/D-chiro-inositol 1-dehydrogenase
MAAKAQGQEGAMLRFALFGAGRIGAMHAANIAASRDGVLHCVYDHYTEAARRVASVHDAAIAASVADALGDSQVDAVLIASSTDTHVDLITAAVRAGKAVLCEKPIDLDIARVERCRQDIAGATVPVQIGFNRRYDPSHRAVREAVAAGEIGAVHLLVITSRDPGLAPMDYMKTSGGIFRDMTIHDLDLARFILGEDPTEVYAAGSVLIEPALAALGDVDTAMLVLKAPSGALVHINNSRHAVYGYDQRVEAFGAHGMVQSENWRATSLRRSSAQATDAQAPLLHFFIERYAQAYRDELDDFIACVESGRAPHVGFEDGRRALILADAAFESLRAGRAVAVRYD